ncbi:MAG TPA: RDD family protein [Candidatus Binatia bacterium]|nr:RDD family protein [Candidatus Binatia bacterium]
MNDRTPTEEPGTGPEQSQASSAAGTSAPPTAGLPPPLDEPPPTASTPAEEFDRAGFWLRSVAFAIDLAVLGTFSLFLLLTSLFVSALGVEVHSLDAAAADSFSLSSLYELSGLFATAAYFTILHGETGQTIGKSLLGLRVCTAGGEPLGYGRALARFLAYGPSFFFFGVGFLWVGLNPGKRGWHDLLAGTVVVNTYRDEEERKM